jgi:hypothetical protein
LEIHAHAAVNGTCAGDKGNEMRFIESGERTVRGMCVALATATLLLSGCGGGGAGSNNSVSASPGSTVSTPSIPSTPSSNNPTAPDTPTTPGTQTPSGTPQAPASNSAPTISVSLVTQAKVGTQYQLAPKAQDPDGDALAFTIANRPSWATFSTVTGKLSGTPGVGDVKIYSNVIISVSDGKATTTLAPFAIVVVGNTSSDGPTVALQWDVSSASQGNVSGYLIHYGTSATALAQTIEIDNPTVDNYVVEGLAPGTYYFAVRAFTSSGGQGELSNVVEKRVTAS